MPYCIRREMYQRTLRLHETGAFELTDEVQASQPRQLHWLFHIFSVNPWTRQSDEVWHLTVDGYRYRLSLIAKRFEFTAAIIPTKTVGVMWTATPIKPATT